MENDNILMADEKVVYAANNKNKNKKKLKAILGCGSGCVFSPFVFMLFMGIYELLFNDGDKMPWIFMCGILLLSFMILYGGLYITEKDREKDREKYKNDYLYITSYGIRWSVANERNCLPWQDVQHYEVESDGYTDFIIITTNNNRKVTINLSCYLLCHSHDVVSAIKQCIGNSEK